MRGSMKPREIFVALAAFVLLALALDAGTEINSYPSPHDDAFYVMKSLTPSGTWSHLASIKEIASPLFFGVVRFLNLPLRMAFSLGYALALFGLLLELRRWPLPPAACWLAALLPMFAPSHYWVFCRPTADPLAVMLSVCLFAACLALFRRKADLKSTLCAGIIASLAWLNRPEGILSAFTVIFTLLLVAAMESGAGRARQWRLIASRIAVIAVMLGSAMAGICVFNRVHYGFAAPTIIKAAPFQHALKQLMAIDDGAPPRRFVPLSKHALAMAFEKSPTMARARSFWEDNSDGRGWSSDARESDGSIGNGHIQWALLDAAAAMAGPKPVDELLYLQQVGDELEAAMKRGELPRRFVISTAIGPAFTPFKTGFWQALWRVGRPLLGGDGNITQPGDTAPGEQNRIFDIACNRRGALIRETGPPSVKMHGWMALADLSDIPSSIFLDGPHAGTTFQCTNRPDVPIALLGKSIDQANCGFELTTPVSGADETFLIASGANFHEHITIHNLFLKPGSDTVQGRLRAHVDAISFTGMGSRTPPKKWTVINRCGMWLSQAMPFVAALSLAAFVAILRRRRLDTIPAGTWCAVCVITGVVSSILVPRLLLLAALDSSLYSGTQGRYLLPATAVAWTWDILVMGVALLPGKTGVTR